MDSKEDEARFIRKVATDLAFALRKFYGSGVQRIIFCTDNKSWRKMIEIEENDGYKGHREQDESTVNWDKFFEVYELFKEHIQKLGIIHSNIKGAEGDDLLYIWSRVLNKNGENAIVITADKDMYQITKFNPTDNVFTIQYNNNSAHSKVIAPIGFGEWLADDSYSLLDANTFMNGTKNVIQALIRNAPLLEVDPHLEAFGKIFEGDDGDGVPSVFHWLSKPKEGKKQIKYRLSKSRWTKILNKIHEIDGEDVDLLRLSDYYEIVSDVCEQVGKTTLTEDDRLKIKDKIERNTKLVYLHKDIIPAHIFESFKDHYKEVEQNLHYYQDLIRDTKWHVKYITKNTEWEKDDTLKFFGATKGSSTSSAQSGDKSIVLGKKLF
jgi:hypothetical protein